MPRLRTLLAASASAAIALGGVAAAPTADTTDVRVDGSTVTVTGTLAEGLGTLVVGQDAEGDATIPAGGYDLSQIRVAFPEAGRVALSLSLADANPVTGHAPVAVQFQLTPTIGPESVELIAGADPAQGGMEYGSQTCDASTGTNQCSSTPVDGAYADGAITWIVDTTALPGDTINAGAAEVNPQLGSPSAATLTFTGGLIDTAGISALARMPSAELLLDDTVVATGDLWDGGYSVTASDVEAGDHAAQLRLCSGAADFGGEATECTTIDLGTITVG